MKNNAQFSKACEEYEKGNFDEAFDLFLHLSHMGNSNAMLYLANMYTCGEGISCDYKKALFWEEKSYELGNKTALINLGITYRIIGDIRKARDIFEIAFNFGDKEAALELAKLYIVSDKEIEKIKKYLLEALNGDICENSRSEAEFLLKSVSNAEQTR